MWLLHSPAAPLVVAVLALLLACLPGQAGATLSNWFLVGGLAVPLAALAVRWVWLWWLDVTVTVGGVTYKAGPQAQTLRRSPQRCVLGLERTRRAREGFLTPPESPASPVSPPLGQGDEGLATSLPDGLPEWAPFHPSLPFGVPVESEADAPYWRDCDASVFLVRNLCYPQTKEKVPSDYALYDCVGMDMVRDKRRIDCALDRLPSELEGLPRSPEGSPAWSEAWGVPRVLIIGCQIPYKAGRLLGSHPEDDGGLSVLSYFVLSRRSCELLSRGADSPALCLWRRLVEEGASTKEGVCLKVVGRIEDLEKYEVPESFHRFNNKPVLLTKSSTFHSHRLPEVLEVQYDVRAWVYLARSTLVNYHHRAKEAVIEVGYVVEGKTNDELPEQILGCFKVYNMDITLAKWLPTAPFA